MRQSPQPSRVSPEFSFDISEFHVPPRTKRRATMGRGGVRSRVPTDVGGRRVRKADGPAQGQLPRESYRPQGKVPSRTGQPAGNLCSVSGAGNPEVPWRVWCHLVLAGRVWATKGRQKGDFWRCLAAVFVPGIV